MASVHHTSELRGIMQSPPLISFFPWLKLPGIKIHGMHISRTRKWSKIWDRAKRFRNTDSKSIKVVSTGFSGYRNPDGGKLPRIASPWPDHSGLGKIFCHYYLSSCLNRFPWLVNSAVSPRTQSLWTNFFEPNHSLRPTSNIYFKKVFELYDTA